MHPTSTPPAVDRATSVFLLAGSEQANLHALDQMPIGADRRERAWNEMRHVAQRSAPARDAVLGALRQQGVVRAWSPLVLGNSTIVEVERQREHDFVNAIQRSGSFAAIERDDVADSIRRRQPGEPTPAPRSWPSNPARPGVNEYLRTMGVDQAWQRGVTGRGVRVGILDGEVDPHHPALRATFGSVAAEPDYRWRDFGTAHKVPSTSAADSHGTMVAGLIAGRDENAGMYPGLAPDVELVAIQTYPPEIADDPDSHYGMGHFLQGLDWALAPTDHLGRDADPRRGVDILNHSWETGDLQPHPVLHNAFRSLEEAGVVNVGASGNQGAASPAPRGIVAPGSFPEVLTTGMSDDQDQVIDRSSRGPGASTGAAKPDATTTAARPINVIPGGGYGEAQRGSTSAAAALMSGVAALVLSSNRNLTPTQLRHAITSSAVDIGEPGIDSSSGHGRVWVPGAIEVAARA